MRVSAPGGCIGGSADRTTGGSGRRGGSPKIAVPTRTIVAPSSTATSKSWLMPIDSSASIAGVNALRPAADRERRPARGSSGRAPSGVCDRRREQHQARQPDGRGSRARPRRWPAASAPAAPCLVGSPAEIDLHEQFELAPGLGGRLVEFARPATARRSNGSTSNRPPAFRALFDCRWPTRCQRSGRSARLRPSSASFLDLVLAEVDLPGVGGGANVVGVEGLGNGDEADGGGVAPGPAGGARDAIANAVQPGAERGGIEHYFFSCATSPFAVAAFGPSGASFRYVSNSVAASGEVAFVHERHAELIVRFGVVRVGRDRRLERLLGLGDLAAVPQDDALVVERVGVAAGAPPAPRGAPARSPWRWPPPPGRTCAARCRRSRARCRPRRRPASLGSPSCSPPRPCRSPSSARSCSRCCCSSRSSWR